MLTRKVICKVVLALVYEPLTHWLMLKHIQELTACRCCASLSGSALSHFRQQYPHAVWLQSGVWPTHLVNMVAVLCPLISDSGLHILQTQTSIREACIMHTSRSKVCRIPLALAIGQGLNMHDTEHKLPLMGMIQLDSGIIAARDTGIVAADCNMISGRLGTLQGQISPIKR